MVRLGIGLTAACLWANVLMGAPIVILDDGPSSGAAIPLTGTWNYRTESGDGSSKPGSWNGTGSRFAAAGGAVETATYASALPQAGLWEVALWWPTFQWTNNALVQISHSGGTSDRRVNQSVNSARWNRVGRYQFQSTGSVVISSDGADPGSNNVGPVADAVRFEYLGAQITPIAAFASSTNTTNAFRKPVHVIDASGMTDADGDGTGDSHQANDFGDNINWMSNGGDRAGWFVVDLGALYHLYRAEVYNFNAISGRTNRGVGQADVYISTVESLNPASPNFSDASVWQLVQPDALFTAASGTNSYNTPNLLSFDGLEARWFALDIDGNLGDASFVGLSEIQFFGLASVPEPSTLALALLGAASLGAIALRRRRAARSSP